MDYYYNYYKKNMKLIISTLLTVMWLPSMAQAQGKPDLMETLFKIEKKKYKDRTYLFPSVNKLPDSEPLGKLVKTNQVAFRYLLTNFSAMDHKKLKAIEQPEALQEAFIAGLRQNTDFVNIINKAVQPSLNTQQSAPDTASMQQVLNIAVKYFNVLRITPKGNYALKVCAGINGIRQTEAKRQPQIEAFCFAAILKNYRNPKGQLRNEMMRVGRKLYEVNLGLKTEDRLLRAQGALFFMMYNSEVLRKVLKDEYDQKKASLPFVLKG